jgi:uncharacterized protein (DUF305 family)
MLAVVIAVVLVSPVWADGPTNRTERTEVRFLEGMIDHHQMALDMAQDCLIKASTPPVVELCQNVITAQSREIEIMRGWLLVWYGIDYQPMPMMSMMQGGMMQGGMMGSMMQNGMMQGGMMGNTTQPMQPGQPMPGPMMMGTVTPIAPMPGGQHDQHHPGGPAQGGMMPGGPAQGGMMGDPPMMMGMMSGLYALTGVDYEIAWLEAMIDHHDDALHMSNRILEVTQRPELQALAQGIIDAQTGEIEYMEGLITELGG